MMKRKTWLTIGIAALLLFCTAVLAEGANRNVPLDSALDAALNAPGSGIAFANGSAHPWQVVEIDGRTAAKSGNAGAAKLFGPTGGYLVGYLFLALIAGAFVGRYTENKWKSIAFAALGMVLGTMVLYALGTAWLAYSAGMDFQAALWAGVIPFIPGDLVKMVIAVLLGSAVRGRMLRAGILEGNN